MPDLNSLTIFAKIAQANSFSEAARRLNLPISTVSRRIAELENELGVRLIERSTRQFRLTEIGTEILVHAHRSVELRDAVVSVISRQLSDVSGLLRISTPPSIAETLLAPLIGTFQTSYPNVRILMSVTERYVDHISEGVDLAFRYGSLRDSSLCARKLLTYRHQLVASPEYLRKLSAPPQRPGDLDVHRILAFSQQPKIQWRFLSAGGSNDETITLRPQLSMNDFTGLAAALLAGGGIAELPPVCAPELIRGGKLVEVMPDWHFPTFDLSIVHLGTHHMPGPARLFKEFAVETVPTLFPDLPH
jgi:DNA-binding transcriptional LysR family regulator